MLCNCLRKHCGTVHADVEVQICAQIMNDCRCHYVISRNGEAGSSVIQVDLQSLCCLEVTEAAHCSMLAEVSDCK